MADLVYLEDALLVDAKGNATDENELLLSKDFDEIRLWSDQVYMPYRVDPIGKYIRPDSTLHAINIGSMIISRFSYGIPVHLHEFSMDAGVGMVLTTIKGHAKHWQNQFDAEETNTGDSFVVDNSRVEYIADFDPSHLQLNVTFSHDYLETLYQKITGRQAPAEFWQNKVKFGKYSSGWVSLLEYVVRMASINPYNTQNDLLGKHLEEMLGTNILIQWAGACGIDIQNTPHKVTPGYVIKAENYMRDHAPAAPTLSQVATAVGVSSRALHKAFKEYRNTTPMRFLRDIRMEGVRAELKEAPSHVTVSEIVYSWGYLCLGRFASLYKQRYGELPSETRKQSH